jgi:hypothetical protein
MPEHKCETIASMESFLSNHRASTSGGIALEKVQDNRFKTFVDTLMRNGYSPKLELDYEGTGGTFFPKTLTVRYKIDRQDHNFVFLKGTKITGKLTPNFSFPNIPDNPKPVIGSRR